MSFQPNTTDETVLAELGARLARRRVDRNVTQRALGERAGVGRAAVQRIEAGEPVTTTTLIRVLRVLELLDTLDAAVPLPAPSPIQALRTSGRQRRRARSARRAPERTDDATRPWRWGDER